jgi:arsenate reductase
MRHTARKEEAAMTVTIYHNPSCGTSRNTLAMIRQSGEEPEIVEYVKNPPSRARLKELIEAMGISVRTLLREKGTPYAELGLADPKWSDDELIDFLLAHPILINRPIVVTPKGVRLCRPSELVLDLLENPAETFVLRLTVNEEKARICKVPEGEFDFLGYSFGRMYSARTGQARLGYRPSKKSIKRMVEQIRRKTAKSSPAGNHRIAGRLSPVAIARHNGVWNLRLACA